MPVASQNNFKNCKKVTKYSILINWHWQSFIILGWKPNELTHYSLILTSYVLVLQTFGGIFDFDSKSQRLIEVNLQLEDPKVWDDPKQAQALGKEKDA